MRRHADPAARWLLLALALVLLPLPLRAQDAPPSPAAPFPAAGFAPPAGFAVPFADGEVVITRAPHPALSAASAAGPDAACNDTPPIPIEPAGGATTETLTPVFRWSKDADLYTTRIQIATDRRFSHLVYDVVWLEVPAGETAGPLVWDDLAPDTTYYWRLSDACADFFAPAHYSAPATFRTPNPPPATVAAPELLGPPDGGLMPVFRTFSAWRNAPGAYGYQVRLYLTPEDAAADRWEELYWSTSGFLPYAYWRGPSVWYASEPQRTVFWRARLHDGRRWGPYSPLRQVELTDSTGYTFSDLRAVPDGYQFANFAPRGDALDAATLRALFGDAAVCSTQEPACRIAGRAERWAAAIGPRIAQGSAAGMAATALRFGRWRYAFLANEACAPGGCDSPLDFDEDALSAFALDREDVQAHIAIYQARAMTSAGATERAVALEAAPGEVLTTLRDQLRPPGSSLALLIRRHDGRAAHALVPLVLEEPGGDTARIWVYDPNHPADPGRAVEVDAARATWRYDLGGGLGVWAGGASAHTLGVYSPTVSGGTDVLACPWCAGAAVATIVYDGPGFLLITDDQGRRLGELPGGEPVNEIPGAVRDLPPGGLGGEQPIYYAPAGAGYTVEVAPAADPAWGFGTLHVFGPGYAVRVAARGPWPRVVLDAAGAQVSLAGIGDSAVAEVEFVRAGENGDYRLAITGFALESADEVTFSVDETAGDLLITHRRNLDSFGRAYSLLYFPAGRDAPRPFAAQNVPLAPDESHAVHWGAWDGSGSLALTALTAAGTETRLLENEFVPRVHAPLIWR